MAVFARIDIQRAVFRRSRVDMTLRGSCWSAVRRARHAVANQRVSVSGNTTRFQVIGNDDFSSGLLRLWVED